MERNYPMRDENRIDHILKLVGKIWHRYPDWRFGQLVTNLYRFTGHKDFFYVEDEDLLLLLMKATHND